MKYGMKAGAIAVIATIGALAVSGVAAAVAPTVQSVIGPPMRMNNMPQPSHIWVYYLAAVMAAGYFGAIYKTKRWPEGKRVFYFTAGLIVMVADLTGPLDLLAWHRVFVAYIAEQIFIVFLIAPLLLLGTPDWMLRPAFTRPRIRPIVKFLSKPAITFGTFVLIFGTIHYPAVCNHICHARGCYAGIRAALLFGGLMLWWPILSPLPEFPRLPAPLQILYLFFLIIPMTLVGALITLSRSMIYMWLWAPQPWGMTPLSDQRLGGVLMWVIQPFFLIAAATFIFRQWIREDEAIEPPASIAPEQPNFY